MKLHRRASLQQLQNSKTATHSGLGDVTQTFENQALTYIHEPNWNNCTTIATCDTNINKHGTEPAAVVRCLHVPGMN